MSKAETGPGFTSVKLPPVGKNIKERVGKKVDHDALKQALSLELFGRYVAWAAGDREQAVAFDLAP